MSSRDGVSSAGVDPSGRIDDRWGSSYRDGVRRSGLVVVLVVTLGVVAVACGGGGSASTAPSTSTAPSHGAGSTTPRSFTGSPLAWITSEARPWNGRLNRDQAAVDAASSRTSEESASTFFHGLQVACTRMAQDASKSQALPPAPSGQLSQAWLAMTAETQRYADDCLALVRFRSTAALTTWQDSLKSMDTANASLNSVVAAIRAAAAG